MKNMTIKQIEDFLYKNQVAIFYNNTVGHYEIREISNDSTYMEDILVQDNSITSVIKEYLAIEKCPHCDRVINE